MALFELESGRLIPAQFGKPVSQGLDAQVLESIRAQVLEVIDRPLFPVAWITQEQGDPDGGPHSLTALDASGQVVSVEVLSRLDSVTLVGALSRLGEITNLGWMDLASRYPGGIEAFQSGWAEFREAMPPNAQPGPRLILVVGQIDPAVYPALGVLYSSGIEIHRISSRQMSNGRRFLEVTQVTPGMVAGHRAQIGGHQAPRPQLAWQAEGAASASDTIAATSAALPSGSGSKGGQPAAEDHLRDGDGSTQPASEVSPPAPAPDQASSAVSGESGGSQVPVPAYFSDLPAGQVNAQSEPDSLGGPVPAAAVSDSDLQSAGTSQTDQDAASAELKHPGAGDAGAAISEGPQSGNSSLAASLAAPAPEPTPSGAAVQPELLGCDPQGLQAISAVIGQPAVLLWQNPQGQIVEALLGVDGQIDPGNGQLTSDVQQAFKVATGGQVQAQNAWKVWRIGNPYGPTLSEAVEELNREIVREYQQHSHRHARRQGLS